MDSRHVEKDHRLQFEIDKRFQFANRANDEGDNNGDDNNDQNKNNGNNGKVKSNYHNNKVHVERKRHVIGDLIQIMEAYNPYTMQFKRAGERIQKEGTPNLYMKIIAFKMQ
ncbi:hypothetical protein BGZ76_010490 [Entomortierella beljakovae]|nr:hypothetical protein BGZ76_010490 [Entomortierella beljakovae]